MLSYVNKGPWEDIEKEKFSFLVSVDSVGRLQHQGLLLWLLQHVRCLYYLSPAVQSGNRTQGPTVSLPTIPCPSLGKFCCRVPPVRHLTTTSFPREPKRKSFRKLQRTDFQQVPPGWHHSNFSAF